MNFFRYMNKKHHVFFPLGNTESDEAKREDFQNEFESTVQSSGFIFYNLREQRP